MWGMHFVWRWDESKEKGVVLGENYFRMVPDSWGVKGEEDLADIVELKYLIKLSRMDEAHVVAKRAIERSPRIGFYYYVLTLGVTEAIGLRWAKKGLKCPNSTDYVRYALLYRAAEHAVVLGLRILFEAQESDAKFDEGIAFIVSALEDSKAFIDNAPPDTRSMKSVVCIYTIVYFVAKGHELTPDLKALGVRSTRFNYGLF